ncbi:MAG: hypothetical protein IPG60_06120 [Bacteroidetes bacterium]|nr:hypothetical protein [Bacteroidota bacterium]MBP7398099.1 CcoQ/FixQ family Cbb3-type cytochrome c oxidase assembly chaperone [Chitinophagales bacterium]MBK7110307.1 hypothetical protein [Bacteroidota bacterium]MBK8488407.1 hypothetical protein [Bacteroidota bacterium]MBK8681829.1 hypothetical protein [Bacteroidota bacterium]
MDYTNHLTSIAGVDIYPLISLIIFFVFFVLLIIIVVRMRKGYIDEMKQMPLEDDTPENKKIISQH